MIMERTVIPGVTFKKEFLGLFIGYLKGISMLFPKMFFFNYDKISQKKVLLVYNTSSQLQMHKYSVYMVT